LTISRELHSIPAMFFRENMDGYEYRPFTNVVEEVV
jgi:hypothetical protein